MTVMTGTGIIFSRAVRLSLRNPVWVIIGLIQPVLYLALFGPLLEPVAATPGFPPGDAWLVFVPGLLVQLGIFGAAFVGFGLIAELRAGVVERQRVTPTSRLALLLGRVLRDVVVLVIQATILTLAAIPFGLRIGIGSFAVGLATIALLGASFSAVSYAAALTLRTEDSLASVLNGLSVPLLLLSGILLPMSLAPTWLQRLSDVNPLKHIVGGLRAVFRGDLATATSAWGLAWVIMLVVVAITFGTKTFRRESA